MKNSRLYASLLLTVALAGFLTPTRANASDSSTIKFSDPAKPGTLHVNVANGNIRIQGTDAAEVTVKTDLKPEAPALRKDGLRVLTSSSSYSLAEHDNVVTLAYGPDTWASGGGDFTIAVPRSTTVIVSNNLGGNIAVADTTGNIEIKSLNGEVDLSNIAGSALVETRNGKIRATVRALVDNKPLSFTSLNGVVVLYLPAAAKANVRLRTHNGSILTDFDENVLVTKTESMRPSGQRAHAPHAADSNDSDSDVSAAVQEAGRAVAEAAREAAFAAKQAAIAAREAVREARAENGDDDDASVPPIPPMAPLPPMTGGKIVTGTLNGGGPEIRITTMNGDVTLRKIPEKK